MNNNWQPRIGQKVVALRSGDHSKKGQEYIVLSLIKCSKCGMWYIGHTVCEDRIVINDKFPCCSIKVRTAGFYYGASTRFAPLPEQYPDCTAAIAAQSQTVERYDGVPVSVPREKEVAHGN
jgi:hypothetical protein